MSPFLYRIRQVGIGMAKIMLQSAEPIKIKPCVTLGAMDCETEMNDRTKIDYASPVPEQQAIISPRAMFFLLLPVALFGMEVVADFVISNISQDDRDYGGMALIFLTAPFALGCGIASIVIAQRRGGMVALKYAAKWLIGSMTLFWLVLRAVISIHFGRN